SAPLTKPERAPVAGIQPAAGDANALLRSTCFEFPGARGSFLRTTACPVQFVRIRPFFSPPEITCPKRPAGRSSRKSPVVLRQSFFWFLAKSKRRANEKFAVFATTFLNLRH